MEFTDEQLLRIAKVIKQEPIFQKIFDKNLEGKISDAEVIGHVFYYEKNGELYGYNKPKPNPIPITMKKAMDALQTYKILERRYGGRLRTPSGLSIESEIEKIYGVPMVKATKKRTKKVQPTRTRKSKKTEPVPFIRPKEPTQEEFNKWLKNKKAYIDSVTTESSVDGMIRTRYKYKFPDGSTVEETELNGNVISQHINRSYNSEPYGYPFITGGY